MNLSKGDRVKYRFPDPGILSRKQFTGMIDFIGETFIMLKDETNTVLKISAKNFHLIEPDIKFNHAVYAASENFYG